MPNQDQPAQPSRGSPRKAFPLRLDPALYKQLKAWAEQEMRSVNGQIEFLLREAVKKRQGGQDQGA